MDTYRACVIRLGDAVMVGVMVAVLFADFYHVLRGNFTSTLVL